MTKAGRWSAIGFLAALLAASSGVSCGGGDGGSCSAAPPACGGDIVGNWSVTSSCVRFMGPLDDPQCPTATVDATVHFSGTASYTATMTYTQSVTQSGTETILLPAACLSASCAQVDQALQASPPDGATSIHCVTAGSGCSCTATLMPQSTTETGTYTLSGTGVNTTSSAGDTETDQYCATGTHLDIMPGPSSAAPGVTTSGSIGLTK
jgi:hypothetical protein